MKALTQCRPRITKVFPSTQQYINCRYLANRQKQQRDQNQQCSLQFSLLCHETLITTLVLNRASVCLIQISLDSAGKQYHHKSEFPTVAINHFLIVKREVKANFLQKIVLQRQFSYNLSFLFFNQSSFILRRSCIITASFKFKACHSSISSQGFFLQQIQISELLFQYFLLCH